MAVKFIAAHHRYSGLSTDTQPTTGVPVGSTFWETDKGRNYEYDGTTWNVTFPHIDAGHHGNLVIIDLVHHEVHAGHHFSGTFMESLASGSSSNILMETPGSATAEIHFVAAITTSAAGSLTFQEAPNTTAGTVIIPYNNKREESGSSEIITLTHNGAITSAGTVLSNVYLGGGASNKIGAETGLRNEWIMNHSTRYVLEYVSSAASIVAWNLFWYEEAA